VRPLAGLDLTDTVAGPKVTALKIGGPGAAAGLKVGDTIIRLNGKEVRSKHDFVGALSRCVPGQCVDVAHRKDGHAVVVAKLYLGSAAVGMR
jgi:S1-C subfamily serine protease